MPRVRCALFGLTDPGQAIEAGLLGIDAAVVAVGEDGPPFVRAGVAREIARRLPPLTGRFALLAPGQRRPPGFGGTVVDLPRASAAASGVTLVRVDHDRADPERIPAHADGVWVRPAPRGSATATRFDFRRLERVARRFPLLLEVPDGAAGVEVAIRLARPHAVLLGEAVWFRPGIVDLEALERALAVVHRLNRRLAEPGA